MAYMSLVSGKIRVAVTDGLAVVARRFLALAGRG